MDTNRNTPTFEVQGMLPSGRWITLLRTASRVLAERLYDSSKANRTDLKHFWMGEV